MMNAASWMLAATLMLAAMAAGCDGAASARIAGEQRDAASDDASDASAAGDVATAGSGAKADGANAADIPKTRAIAAKREGNALVPGVDGYVETSFDDLQFPMAKTDLFAESMFTDRVRSLFDRKIRLRGYMYPTLRKKGLKQFVLVRDNMECCFGPGAALYDCVLVTMAGGATAEYSIYPVAVEGTFRFETLDGPEGRPLAIYQMAGEAVE
jgi:hypothetical protein